MNSSIGYSRLLQDPHMQPRVLSKMLQEAVGVNNNKLTSALTKDRLDAKTDAEFNTFVKSGPRGLTHEMKGSVIEQVTMGAGHVKAYDVLKWADKYRFDEDALEDLRKLSQAGIKEKLDTLNALNKLAVRDHGIRIANRVEWIWAKYTTEKNFSINGKTIDPGVPDFARLDLNDSATTNYTDVRDLPGDFGWTPTALWSDRSATILEDISNIKRFAANLGFGNIVKAYPSGNVESWIANNSEMRNLIGDTNNVLSKVDGMVANQLGIVPMEAHHGTYEIETIATAAASASATSITVADYRNIVSGAILTYRDGTDYYITEVTATPTSSTVSVSALPAAMSANAVLTFSVPFIPNDYVVFVTDKPYQGMVTKPKLITVNGKEQMLQGEWSTSYFEGNPDSPIYTVSSGFYGMPVIWHYGGFLAVKVG